MQKFIDIVTEEVKKLANENSVELYEITFRLEKNGRVLRINLDGNVTLDVCTNISRKFSEWLDSMPEDFIPYNKYLLEVSSLGMDRPLKNASDFKKYFSKICRIQTKNKDNSGRKRYKGKIENVTDNSVTIYSDEESTRFTIDFNNIHKAQLEIEI